MERNFWKTHSEQLDYIIKWYPHWGSRVLSDELKISQKAISNKVSRLRLIMLPRSERICYGCKCNKMSPKLWYGLYCAECRNKRALQNYYDGRLSRTLEQRLKELVRVVKSRNKRKNYDCDITYDFLLELWNKQQGKCPYTGVSMTYEPVPQIRKPLSEALSIDRVDSKKPYSKDNVVLCTNWSNIAKGVLPIPEFVYQCYLIVNHFKATHQNWNPEFATEDNEAKFHTTLFSEALKIAIQLDKD